VIIIATAMAQLIVRDIDEGLVRALKLRAARHGTSAEEEHRQILRRALFKDLLSQMPEGGEDSDFERADDREREIDL
jgi:plasmid stability protein